MDFVDDGELNIDLEIWPRHIGWGAGMGNSLGQLMLFDFG
jgi:hypothetical protein